MKLFIFFFSEIKLWVLLKLKNEHKKSKASQLEINSIKNIRKIR